MPARVHENRVRAASRLAVGAERLLSLHQVHGRAVIVVEAPWSAPWSTEARGERPKADAMVTDRPGIALGILSADCAPVLLADAEARVIGAAHAGWRGPPVGVIEATVAAMVQLAARLER